MQSKFGFGTQLTAHVYSPNVSAGVIEAWQSTSDLIANTSYAALT